MKNSWLKARVLPLLALHPWNEIVIVRCRAQPPFCIHFQFFFPAFLGGHCAKPRVAWRENRREADAEGFGRAEVEHLARRAGLVSCPSSFSLIPTLAGLVFGLIGETTDSLPNGLENRRELISTAEGTGSWNFSITSHSRGGVQIWGLRVPCNEKIARRDLPI